MKKIQKVTAWLLAFVMVLTLAPAGQVDAASKVNVKKVTVSSSLSGSKKTVVVAKGKKVKLTTVVTVTPNKSANKKVTYTSQDKKIATVDSKGNVKGVKAGSTKITVTSTKNKKKKATITVKVMKGAVTKVTLDQTSGTLNVGDSIALKATVKAKSGANKTVAWTSSNNAVVTVNSKGQVTAVGAGSASVTAKAIDGSGKKAVYKVTVQDPIFLTGINVLNAQSVTFSLNKACPIDASQVSVMNKQYANGTYRNQLVIENMSTTDNVNYTVVLSNDSRINNNNYVQIAIPSLTGVTKTIETIYSEPLCAYTDDINSIWSVGEYNIKKFYFDSDYASGYASLSISNLPAGLTAENKNSSLVVKGVPSNAGVTAATLTATDELGNTMTKTINFIVGSDTVIAGAATPYYGICSGNTISIGKYPSVTGGSGSYTYRILSDPSGISTRIDSDGELHCSISFPGEYIVTVRVSDEQDANRYCDIAVPFSISQGIAVGGCVTDAQGNKIPYADIYFTNKNKADRYCTGTYVYTNSNGVYSAVVVSGNYDIEVDYMPNGYGNCSLNAQATRYLYNQPLNSTQTGFDLQLPLYKVILKSNEDNTTVDISDLDWYWNHEYVGSGTQLYLKAGNYTLEAEAYSYGYVDGVYCKITYKYTASANIVDSGVQVGVTRTIIKQEEYD